MSKKNFYGVGLQEPRTDQNISDRKIETPNAAPVVIEKDNSKLVSEFDTALKHFSEDESYFSEYEKYDPLGSKVLIKLFQFKPKSSSVGKSFLYIPDANGDWKPAQTVLAEKIFPIAKVIKVGKKVEDEFIKPGMLFTVSYDEICGEEWNPDFLHLVNTFAKGGTQGKLINIPDGMKQRLPKLQIAWKGYKFSMPDRLESETDEDKLIYLIPAIKLEAIYHVD